MSAVAPCTSLGSRRRAAWLTLVVGVGTLASAPVLAAAPFDPGAPRLVEGDILVAPMGSRGIGSAAGSRRWSNGEVPYVLDPTLADTSVAAVHEAVATWNAASVVTLTEAGPAASPPFDHLVFRDGPGCASWVGRQGGPQDVWIASSCTPGSVMHEIGHALGLEHEHNRPDRDVHVRVVWENILPEKRHNFAIALDDARESGDYDLDSIMHYGPANFSIDGGPTLVPHVPGAGTHLGQRIAPSAGDLATVARLYASDLALSVSVDGEREAREVTLFVTNHHPQGAHDVLVMLAADDPRILGGDAGWHCTSLDGLAGCRLERLAGHATSRVALAVPTSADAVPLRATLSSKTPDLDPANNGGGTALDDSVVELARALSGDVAATSDDAAAAAGAAAGAGSADAAHGGAGGPAALALLALALGRRRRGLRYCASGSSPSGARPSSGIAMPSWTPSWMLPSGA